LKDSNDRENVVEPVLTSWQKAKRGRVRESISSTSQPSDVPRDLNISH
jgi:hypothetical protein